MARELFRQRSLPAEFLKELGVHDLPHGGIGIRYFGPTGEDLFVRERGSPRTKGKRFYQPAGVPLQPYGEWKLDEARKAGVLLLVEGESDCWALWHHGITALGLPGSSSAKCLAAEHIEDIASIYIVEEPDQGGSAFKKGCLDRLKALGYRGRVLVMRMPSGIKDPADLHADHSERFLDRLKERMLEAPIILSERSALPEGSDESKPGDGRTPVTGLATTCLATIRPQPIRWMVPGRIPLGKLILIAGDGGHGKSSMTLDGTACTTTGQPWFGLDYKAPPASDVLLISCEDDFADTVVPRLLSATADLRRVHRVDGIQAKHGEVLPFNMAYYKQMEAELEKRPEIRLVVIDPAGAYIGKSGVDDYKDSELRALLGPMSELAARRQVTIFLVKHFIKGTATRAAHKVGGSSGYVNAVRAAYVVVPSREDENLKLLLPVKFNTGPRPNGLAFRTEALTEEKRNDILQSYGSHLTQEERDELAGQLFRIAWQGTTEVDADELLAEQARRERGPNKVEKAAAWLERFLGEYAYPSEEIVQAGNKAGYTFDNIKEAKVFLKGKGLRSSNRGRFQGIWWTGFGEADTWTLRPPPLTPDTPISPQTPHTGSPLSTKPGKVGKAGSSGSEGGGYANPDAMPEDLRTPFDEEENA